MILEAAFAIAIDGDTVALQGERVRIWGIQAPELRDPGGRASKAELAALLAQGATTCHVWTRDRYGRHVGMCFVRGEDVAWKLIRANLAEDWPRYSRGYYARPVEPLGAEPLGASWHAFCDANGRYCSLERK